MYKITFSRKALPTLLASCLLLGLLFDLGFPAPAMADPLPGTNVALSSRGGAATVSSQYNRYFSPSSINDGDKRGGDWGNGGGWADATPNDFTNDWAQIDFNASYTIDTINVFTLQDNAIDDQSKMEEPDLTLDFINYGLKDFDVQYWDGSAWKNVPGGHITDNVNVWRQLRFAPVTTTKIRVVVHNALNMYSRIVEIEALTAGNPKPQETGANVALVSNRAVATASSVNGSAYSAEYVMDGDTKGANGIWMDATPNDYTNDWVQIQFDAVYTINQIDVYTAQNNLNAPQYPLLDMTFASNGITSYNVQYWNGSSWAAVPGGSVTGNDKVWNRFKFSDISTNKIRVVVTGSLNGYSRIAEVQAMKRLPDNMLSSTSKKFIDYGLQFQTLLFAGGSPTAQEWINSNFTAPEFFQYPNYDKTLADSVPGFQWSTGRALNNNGGEELLYPPQLEGKDNLVIYNFNDETPYSTEYLQRVRDIIKRIRVQLPKVLTHNNQIGGTQWNFEQLRQLVREARPDIINFDNYYFYENGSDIGLAAGITGNTAGYRKYRWKAGTGPGNSRSPSASS